MFSVLHYSLQMFGFLKSLKKSFQPIHFSPHASKQLLSQDGCILCQMHNVLNIFMALITHLRCVYVPVCPQRFTVTHYSRI